MDERDLLNLVRFHLRFYAIKENAFEVNIKNINGLVNQKRQKKFAKNIVTYLTEEDIPVIYGLLDAEKKFVKKAIKRLSAHPSVKK